jgi:tripartite-type tricarboxylate transporter receptor subunit TctC
MKAILRTNSDRPGRCREHRRRIAMAHLAFILGAALMVAGSPVNAQSYPTGNIRMVVSAAAGTPPSIISHIVANEVGQSEGWRLVVESKPGAMQTLAGAEVLKLPADGHTLLSTSLPGMSAPALLPNVPFNLATDFVPVIKLSTSYNVLVVHPSVPARSVAELVALARQEPDKLTFSSGGFGTPAHLIGELFKLKTGIRTTHVPYQKLPGAIADLLNGTNHYQFLTMLPVLDLIAAGKLRALAVTAPTRLPALKEVPTVVEAGYPELVVQDWFGYLVKKGTPDAAVVALNGAINNALTKPNVRAALAKLTVEPAGGTPTEFGDFYRAQLGYWAKVVKDSGMKMHR